MNIGGVDIELEEAPDGHTDGDIFMYLPAQRTVMVVDIAFPGWVPFQYFAVAQSFAQYVQTMERLLEFDADKFVCGHLNRIGSRDDIAKQKEFVLDVEAAAVETLASALLPNVWLLFNEVGIQRNEYCYNLLAPKWAGVLGGFDVFTRTHCQVAITWTRLE
jgi:glyoxylase-like metal-dependent hydrolase (beta-lactamase superfamily II)